MLGWPALVASTLALSSAAHAGWGDRLRGRATPAPRRVRTFTLIEDQRAAIALGLSPSEWISRLNHLERGLEADPVRARHAVERFVVAALAQKALDASSNGGSLAAEGYYNHYLPASRSDDLKAHVRPLVFGAIERDDVTLPEWAAIASTRHFFAAARRPSFYVFGALLKRLDRTDLDVANLKRGTVIPDDVRAVLDFREMMRPTLPRLREARDRLSRAPFSPLVNVVLDVIFEIEVRVGDWSDLDEAFRAERAFVTRVYEAQSELARRVLEQMHLRFDHPAPRVRGPMDRLGDPVAILRWLDERWVAPPKTTPYMAWRVKRLKQEMRETLASCDISFTR